MAHGRILVADDSPVIQHMISSFLGKEGYEIISAKNGEEALRVAARERPDVAIIDVMMPGMNGYDVCKELRRLPQTAKLPIILLTSRGGVADRITGLQAGADDYVTKPFDLRELLLRVQALLARVSKVAGPTRARVITCFSLKGGVGVSTLSANLAIWLAELWERKVALVDLAVNSGHAALMLDMFPAYTIADLAKEQPENVPDELMSHYMTEHASGVHLLAAPRSTAMTEDLSPSLVEAVLEPLNENFDYVIVDTMHSFSQATLSAIEHTHLLVLVVTPDMASVKSANDALTILNSIGFPQGKLATVLNRTNSEEGIPVQSIEEALGMRIVAQIPYEGRSAMEAVNRGTPVAISAPTTGISEAIGALAFRVTKKEVRDQPNPQPSLALQRIAKRLTRTKRLG